MLTFLKIYIKKIKKCSNNLYFIYLFKMFITFSIILNCFIVSTLVQADDNDDILENPQETLTQCLEKFSSADYIMEPGIFSQLKR